MNSEIKDPITIPPGNHMWNLLSIWFIFTLLSEYESAIRGLHAASVQPLPKPIQRVEISSVVYPSAKIVVKIPIVCIRNATFMMFLGPNEWYTRPPIIIEIGNPRNHIWLIYPSCSADRPNLSPSWGKIPARIENVNAVVIKAKQLRIVTKFLSVRDTRWGNKKQLHEIIRWWLWLTWTCRVTSCVPLMSLSNWKVFTKTKSKWNVTSGAPHVTETTYFQTYSLTVWSILRFSFAFHRHKCEPMKSVSLFNWIKWKLTSSFLRFRRKWRIIIQHDWNTCCTN